MVKSSYEQTLVRKNRILYTAYITNQTRIAGGGVKSDSQILLPSSTFVDIKQGEYYLTASEIDAIVRDNTCPVYPPINVIAYNGGDQEAIITWTPSEKNTANNIVYIVTSFPDGLTSVTTENFIRISGLTNGTHYTFSINAKYTFLIIPRNMQIQNVVSSQVVSNSMIPANPKLSVTFNGTTQKLTAPANDGFYFGLGQFTWEAWFYYTGSSAINNKKYTIMNMDNGLNTAYLSFSVQTYYVSGTPYNSIFYTYNYNQTAYANWVYGVNSFPSNTWTHICMMRNGDTITVFINGKCISAQTTNVLTSLMGSTSWNLNIGGNSLNTNPFSGRITNARIVKGSNIYPFGKTVGTTYFTPPTTPLTAITGTSFLLQGLIDTSSNYASITNTGAVATDTNTPFL